MHLARTATIEDQERVQELIDELCRPYARGSLNFDYIKLEREAHVAYLLKGLEPLPSAFVSLDANMPWICFWILQALDLLNEGIPEGLKARVLNTLRDCQHPNGGFGGGPKQEAHLACTYAGISAMAIIGTEEAYEAIDLPALRAYLKGSKQPDGSFAMHLGGEADCRGSYCALASASLCGILDEVAEGPTAEYIASCQSYEGGLGGVPYSEAHAGYTYCGFAALTILDRVALIDLDNLASFARRSQCGLSGGFRGRTSKLVDGCYSFWAGALFPLLRKALPDLAPFDALALQKYILVCCQDQRLGGLRDKPGKNVDYYHSGYCLAGLAVAQQEPSAPLLGLPTNVLPEIDVVYNLRPERLAHIQEYFTRRKNQIQCE